MESLQIHFLNPVNWWGLARNTGIAGIADHALRKKVRLTNQIAATNAIITVIYIAFFTIINSPLLRQLAIPILAGYFLTFLLNHYRYYDLARLWLAFVSNTAIYMYAVLFGRESGIQYFFVAYVGIPIILFELKHKYYILICLLFTVTLFWAVEANFGHFIPITDIATQHKVYMYMMYLIFVLLTCYLIYFAHNNERFEAEISQARGVAANANIGSKDNSLADILKAQIEELRKSKVELQLERDLLDFKVKERTEELLTSNESLTQEIRIREVLEEKQEELLQDLNHANQDLKDFAHTVSHDLKAPLRAIKTLVEWVIKDNEGKFDKETVENLVEMDQKASHMQQLIDGILHYSMISRQKEVKVEVALDDIFKEAIFLLSPPPHFTITKDPLPTLVCAKTQMLQVLQNLISNAVKYNDKPQGLIHISCIEKPAEYGFCVRDNGKGIENRYFDKIFQLFESLERENDRGAGIGLNIVKQAVEMHGGKIWVESEPGIGSKFHFTLPKNTSKNAI